MHSPDSAQDTSSPAGTSDSVTQASCLELIRDVADFPKPGIVFKDITPLLASGPHFQFVVAQMARLIETQGVPGGSLAGPEARGFIFGAALASSLGRGFIPIRKPGKLPYKRIEVKYDLEYGSDQVEMHVDAVSPGQKIILIDDLLATGGTTKACAQLIEKAGGEVVACVFLVELGFLDGRAVLEGYPIHSLIKY